MIVKNESSIIESTLTKLLEKVPQIDYYVISDTGSEDDTIHIIKTFFKKRKIKGEIYEDEWRDFGYNRTLALKYAFKKSRYLLIFDADDEIYGTITLPDLNQTNEWDGLLFKFGPGIIYQRILLIQNHIKWYFKGVLHEYICCEKPNPHLLSFDGNYFVLSGKTGARNNDPLKYQKDALILENAYTEAKLANDSLQHRYCFYCAQSYHDANNKEKAVEWYKKVLEHECWIQEKYYACYRLYHCLTAINCEKEGIYYLVKSIEYDIERYDCVYELIRYYCGNGMEKIAWHYYLLIKEDMENDKEFSMHNKLFVNMWYRNFGIPYYIIITAINLKKYETAQKMYEIIFTKKHPETNSFYIKHLLYNINCVYSFVNDKLKFQKLLNEYFLFLSSIRYNIQQHYDIYKSYFQPSFLSNSDTINNYSKTDCFYSNNILIYTGNAYEPWNYSFYKEKSLGGSESKAIELALELSKKYNIYIIGNVKEERYKNIEFISFEHATEFINTHPFYCIIVSRYLDFFEKYKYSTYQLFVWAHDIAFHSDHLIPFYISKIDCCICLSNWHKDLFIKKYPLLSEKIKIIPNGIVLKPKYNCDKVRHRFIYSSCIERGLEKVVELWPFILKKWSDAELYICCYNKFPQNAWEIELSKKINSYPSIHYLGKLKKEELYKLQETCEYWLYPTNWLETSCVTAMEMMSYGVLCCYYPIAALCDTIGSENGLVLEVGKEIEMLCEINEKEKLNYINNAYKHIESFHWDNIVCKWLSLIDTSLYLFILHPHYEINNIEDYLDSLETKYNIIYTKDISYAMTLLPTKVFYIHYIFESTAYEYFHSKNIEINILNTEPLNLKIRYDILMSCIEKANYVYDYSESNIVLLNRPNTVYFPYIIYQKEQEILKELRKNIQKTYDFGILIKDDKVERRNKVIEFYKKHFKLNVIMNKWKMERDIELAKCKIILNIHGFYYETTQIFEQIRCDRLLHAGFTIVSEKCLHFSENKYPNLFFIDYLEFFDMEILKSLLQNVIE
jgi:hypothetical protein